MPPGPCSAGIGRGVLLWGPGQVGPDEGVQGGGSDQCLGTALHNLCLMNPVNSAAHSPAPDCSWEEPALTKPHSSSQG